MKYFNKNYLKLFVCLLLTAACSKNNSIYGELKPDEDGVISVGIPSQGEESASLSQEPLSEEDKLSAEELKLVNKWHEGETDKLSFLVVDAASNKVLRSYYAEAPQRLASISKLSTALGALENVRNVEVPKVQRMLKTSNNGEASRYVRLAAKALDNLVLDTTPYKEKHSCPDEFLKDEPAAHVVLDWLKVELPNVNWQGASLNDGAGCNYNNFMTPVQTVKILEYAAKMGEAYDGKNFEDLLSINGVDGTWKNKNLDHKGYIFAKTGTLNPNGNLAGYFYANRNNKLHKYYFSIFVQKKGAGQYSINARKLMEAMMRYWINYYSTVPGTPIKSL